ncbi:hypothetical protein [Carboxylicivirga taeanensis]|uniref:hypothetical protein n=1 Tax=Carboxylicivirga taeanensis TaxID=1416875 RepID=UPI003F6E0042
MRGLITILIIGFITACNGGKSSQRQIKSGLIEVDDHYLWKIDSIGGWEYVSMGEIQNIEERGQQLINELTEEEVEVSHENLVLLKKDDFNSLIVTRQLHSSLGGPTYNVVQDNMFEAIIETYKAQEIKFTYEVGVDTIGGLVFKALETDIYAFESDTVILSQKIWDRLFDNYSFTININYSNKEDEELLRRLVNESSFIKI